MFLKQCFYLNSRENNHCHLDGECVYVFIIIIIIFFFGGGEVKGKVMVLYNWYFMMVLHDGILYHWYCQYQYHYYYCTVPYYVLYMMDLYDCIV